MKNKFIYLALLAFGFMACHPEFKNSIGNTGTYSAGDADFSSYVAIGNSLTSGFMDGTVFRVGQSYSFPSILAKQFALVGGGAFTQPSYADDVNNVGGLILGGMVLPEVGKTRLIINASVGGPQNIKGTSSIDISKLQATAYNNMGIPAAKSYHLMLSGYGDLAGVSNSTANPYFVRHATTPSATVIGDAMTKKPTFFTNWIGNNDVLGYATAGGIGTTTGMKAEDITPVPFFETTYTAIIDALTANGAKGVVATIPDVTTIPFFTTVPYNPLSLTVLGEGNEAVGAATVQALNAQLYGPLKQILTGLGEGDRINLLSETADNPLLIKDKDLTDLGAQIEGIASGSGMPAVLAKFLGDNYGQARQAKTSDLVLLTTKEVIGTASIVPAPDPSLNKYGITYPLEDQHVLIASEIQNAQDATVSFNNIIKSVAASKNLAVADMNAIMTQLVSGLKEADGQIYTSDYFSTDKVSTVLFSLDGVHPNARGYAVISNEIIKVINNHFNANIPQVSAAEYPGATILVNNK